MFDHYIVTNKEEAVMKKYLVVITALVASAPLQAQTGAQAYNPYPSSSQIRAAGENELMNQQALASWNTLVKSNQSQKECLVNRKTKQTICHTRKKWAAIASKMDAPAAE